MIMKPFNYLLLKNFYPSWKRVFQIKKGKNVKLLNKKTFFLFNKPHALRLEYKYNFYRMGLLMQRQSWWWIDPYEKFKKYRRSRAYKKPRRLRYYIFLFILWFLVFSYYVFLIIIRLRFNFWLNFLIKSFNLSALYIYFYKQIANNLNYSGVFSLNTSRILFIFRSFPFLNFRVSSGTNIRFAPKTFFKRGLVRHVFRFFAHKVFYKFKNSFKRLLKIKGRKYVANAFSYLRHNFVLSSLNIFPKTAVLSKRVRKLYLKGFIFTKWSRRYKRWTKHRASWRHNPYVRTIARFKDLYQVFRSYHFLNRLLYIKRRFDHWFTRSIYFRVRYLTPWIKAYFLFVNHRRWVEDLISREMRLLVFSFFLSKRSRRSLFRNLTLTKKNVNNRFKKYVVAKWQRYLSRKVFKMRDYLQKHKFLHKQYQKRKNLKGALVPLLGVRFERFQRYPIHNSSYIFFK